MNALRITCWNVNGLLRKNLFNKLEDEEFFRSVNNYDIIGLVETHSGPDDNICVTNL